jgi:hypothetical protein
MKKLVTALVLLLGGTVAYAQSEQAAQDTTTRELPFALSDEKRLTDEDIANKKEGWYVTGVPEASVDPIRGFGIGASAFIFNNKDRQDPFFEYTPYRTLLAVFIRGAQSGQVQGGLSVDVPFAFNTRWRLRGDIILESDPNRQYFGMGSETLGRLGYIDKRNMDIVANASFRSYATNLARTRPGQSALRPGGVIDPAENPGQQYTDMFYNEYASRNFLYAVAAERAYFEGRMRLMFGYEMQFIDINPYDGILVPDAIHATTGESVEAIQGKTKFTEDYEASLTNPDSYWARKNIGGYNGGRVALFQTGIMWDTRDLEPDPTRGMFAEYAQEVSFAALGSQFNFSKHLVQVQYFQPVLPQIFGRSRLAGRMGMGTIRGSYIPVSEAFDMWSSSFAGGIPVMGGANSLRGYRANRFTGMVYGWGNLEWRHRFAQTRILNQHLAFSAVPFYDVGSVWDSFREINVQNFRHSVGLGARIAWNQATILRFDYAVSREDAQFFFIFGHAF